jgi:hypothetical protein
MRMILSCGYVRGMMLSFGRSIGSGRHRLFDCWFTAGRTPSANAMIGMADAGSA